MAVKEKIAYVKDIEEATALPSGATSGNIVIFGDGKLVDSQRNLDDIPDKEQVRQEISEAIESHAESDGHVTAEDREKWNSKQDAIGDLQNIRTNASKGAEAKTELAEHENNQNVHVTPEEKTKWNSKQDAIGDLGTIRENAEKGLEAAGRDEIVMSGNTVDAVSSEVSISSDQTIVSMGVSSESRPQACGFKMNLMSYVKGVASDVKIREVCFRYITVYLFNSTVAAKLVIYRAGEENPIAESGKLELVSASGGAQNTFEFLTNVWLAADAEYEFKIVTWDGGITVPNLTLYLSPEPIIEGFKEYSGDSYSSWEGCFKGESVFQLKTSARIELAKKSDIPTKTSQLENDSNFVDQTALDDKVDKEDFTSLERAVKDGTHQKQADWLQNDPAKPDFIKNKPKIPNGVTVDATLTKSGFAADAQTVGLALARLNPHYKSVSLTPTVDDHVMRYQLVDRAVNHISLDVAYGDRIALEPPNSTEAGSVREFVVVFNIATESDLVDEVSIESDGNMVNYAGETAEILASVGRLTVFRFIEIHRASDRFLVTGASDPAYTAVRQMEQALDDILADGGISELTTPFRPGVYLYNVDTGKYHKVVISGGTEDDEEVNIGVEQEGVQK